MRKTGKNAGHPNPKIGSPFQFCNKGSCLTYFTLQKPKHFPVLFSTAKKVRLSSMQQKLTYQIILRVKVIVLPLTP